MKTKPKRSDKAAGPLTALQKLARYKAAVAKFCAEQSWTCQEWKDQAHIKPLFDLNNEH